MINVLRYARPLLFSVLLYNITMYSRGLSSITTINQTINQIHPYSVSYINIITVYNIYVQFTYNECSQYKTTHQYTKLTSLNDITAYTLLIKNKEKINLKLL